jgi:hypothetical protein
LCEGDEEEQNKSDKSNFLPLSLDLGWQALPGPSSSSLPSQSSQVGFRNSPLSLPSVPYRSSEDNNAMSVPCLVQRSSVLFPSCTHWCFYLVLVVITIPSLLLNFSSDCVNIVFVIPTRKFYTRLGLCSGNISIFVIC